MDKNNAYLKRPAWTATIAAMIAGIAVHMFGLVNVLHNNDDIWVQPIGYGTGLTSGRWSLDHIGRFINRFFGGYNLPWLNGVIFITLLSVAAGLLVSVLKLKKRKSAVCIGVLFIVFPTVASTLFYRFTAGYYGVAILLSVLATWVLERYKFTGLLLSALCTAFSMGIYQAYIPITISIFVLLLIRRILQGDTTAWKVVLSGLYYCAAIILGVVLYYLLLQFHLEYTNTSLSTYEGVNEMGQLSLVEIPNLVRSAITSFVRLPIDGYCGLAEITILKYSYLILGMLSIGLIIFILIFKIKKIDAIFISILLCAVFPLAVNFIVVMVPETAVTTMTVYSFVITLCVPFVLIEALPSSEKKWLKMAKNFVSKAVMVIIVVAIAGYAYLTNVNYTALYYANRQAENYMSSIVTQVRMTEGFDTEKTWALIGKISDPLIYNKWHIPEIIFRGNFSMRELVVKYSHRNWFSVRYGYSIPFASDEVVNELSNSEEVKAMPCWPNEGSIKVIGDSVVVKFQELSN